MALAALVGGGRQRIAGRVTSRSRAVVRALLSAVLIVTITAVPAALADDAVPLRTRPAAPLRVSAKAGSTGTIATVTWGADRSASSYRIWRSTGSLTGFEPIGSTATTSFTDTSGLPNRTYFYQVTALTASGRESSPSTPTAGVRPLWNQSPHATYGKGDVCVTCHVQHRGEAPQPSGEVDLCYSCHDGQGATANVKDGARDSFALGSGHRVEEATHSADLTNECSSCHSPHADPAKRRGLFAKKVAGRSASAGNAWCAACHDDASRWSPGYPATGTVIRDASGYPVLGTYRGPSVYAATAKSGHAGIALPGSAQKGDCLLCHAAHRGPNAYDGLLLGFRPPSASTLASDQVSGAYAQLCLNCHWGGATWPKQGAADIGRYVTRRDAKGYAGHSIVTSGGVLPVGAPVPCYDCHDPHGSARGNASLLSDALGRDLGTTDASGVRAFCLSCHATSDGRVWSSTAEEYAAVSTATIEGLRRDGSDRSLLRLTRRVPEHASASRESCYGCHGADYGSAAGFNVHAPKRLGSAVTPAASARTAPAVEKTATPSPVG